LLPRYQHVRKLIDEGTIGDVKAVHSDFGINAADHEEYPTSPFYQHALGGGSLLFVGVYPVAVAPFVFGARMPSTIAATGVVDEVRKFASSFQESVLTRRDLTWNVANWR